MLFFYRGVTSYTTLAVKKEKEKKRGIPNPSVDENLPRGGEGKITIDKKEVSSRHERQKKKNGTPHTPVEEMREGRWGGACASNEAGKVDA